MNGQGKTAPDSFVLGPLWRQITRQLFALPSRDGLFNPYADCHPDADQNNAVKIRRENLRRYIGSYNAIPPVLVVGEASGPWGCRFSGVPFTSEKQLCEGALPFKGHQSSINPLPHHERTAGIFWDVMLRYYPRCFIWNAVPLHPHPQNEPFSLRRPSLTEVAEFQNLLSEMINLLRPERIVAVGRIAERAAETAGIVPVYVRHPSHGGMKEFRAGMEAVFAEYMS